jgi:hypothetical protein
MEFDTKKKSESGVIEMMLLFKDINKIADPEKPDP